MKLGMTAARVDGSARVHQESDQRLPEPVGVTPHNEGCRSHKSDAKQGGSLIGWFTGYTKERVRLGDQQRRTSCR